MVTMRGRCGALARCGCRHGLPGAQRQPRVSERTRRGVLDAIELLDYRPNPLARGLSQGRCQTLGVVVPFFTHASAVERLRGVAAALDGSRYDLVLFNVESPIHRDEHFATLTRDRADGLLIMSLPPPPGSLRRLAEAGVPWCCSTLAATASCGRHGRRRGGARPPITCSTSGTSASRSSATIPPTPWASPPAAAVRRATTGPWPGRGDDPRPASCCTVPMSAAWPAGSQKAPRRRDRPTAIAASSDTSGPRGARSGPRELDVPGDVSVVGFDDVEVSGCAGLTTVRQPLFESGRLGARVLLDALDDGHPRADRAQAYALELVERSTTAPPRS